MAKFTPLLVCGLVLCLASARLLTSEPAKEEAVETPAAEVKVEEHVPAENAEKLVLVVPENLPGHETPAAVKAEHVAGKPGATEKVYYPHKNKATFFIVIGIIVLGVGAIGAAHFLKNSQVAR